MKRLIYILFFVICSTVAFGQQVINTPTKYKNLSVLDSMGIPGNVKLRWDGVGGNLQVFVNGAWVTVGAQDAGSTSGTSAGRSYYYPGYGLLMTDGGVFSVDTAYMASRARLKQQIDSILSLFGGEVKYADTAWQNTYQRALNATYGSASNLAFQNGLSKVGNTINANYGTPMWNANMLQSRYITAAQPMNGQTLMFDSTLNMYIWGFPDSVKLTNYALSSWVTANFYPSASNPAGYLTAESDPSAVKSVTVNGSTYNPDPVTGDVDLGTLSAGGGGVDSVLSVFGRTGAVTAQESDYSSFYPLLSGHYNDPVWLDSLAWGKIKNKPSLFDGDYNSLTNKPTLFDGAYSSLSGIPSTFTPSAHTHAAADIVSGVFAAARIASGTATVGYVPTVQADGSLAFAAVAAGGSGNWTLTSTDIYNANAGSVGIGLTSGFGAKLHVKGGSTSSSSYSLKVDNNTGSSNSLLVRDDGLSGFGASPQTGFRSTFSGDIKSVNSIVSVLDGSDSASVSLRTDVSSVPYINLFKKGAVTTNTNILADPNGIFIKRGSTVIADGTTYGTLSASSGYFGGDIQLGKIQTTAQSNTKLTVTASQNGYILFDHNGSSRGVVGISNGSANIQFRTGGANSMTSGYQAFLMDGTNMNVLIGNSTTAELGSIFSVQSTERGSIPYPVVTAAQRASIATGIFTNTINHSITDAGVYTSRGTGYATGVYTNVTFTGGSGSGAVATVTVYSGGTVNNVTITSPGSGYAVGDVLTASSFGGGSGLTLTLNANMLPIKAGVGVYCSDCTAIDGSTGVVSVWNGTTWKNMW